jgi:hypothetical protein
MTEPTTGTPEPGATAAIVAVKVTDWPRLEALEELVTVVVESALSTVILPAPDCWLEPKFVSPT